jgi:hypothetical protein
VAQGSINIFQKTWQTWRQRGTCYKHILQKQQKELPSEQDVFAFLESQPLSHPFWWQALAKMGGCPPV